MSSANHARQKPVSVLRTASALAATALAPAAPALALVKGSAPPPKMSAPKERKCKSIDECEALG